MAKAKTWIITASDDRDIREVAKDLADAGLDGGRVLDEIHCITGSADDEVVGKLRRVPGVVDVSPDDPIDVGPPGSPDTW